MTKAQLLALMNTLLASGQPITAKMLREFQEAIIDAIFQSNGFTALEVTLSGDTYQNNDLIGADEENLMLFNTGLELTTAYGSSFNSGTGTITFATSKSGSAKLYYK